MSNYIGYYSIGAIVLTGITIAFIYFKPNITEWWRYYKNKQSRSQRREDASNYNEHERISFLNNLPRKRGIPNYGNTCYLNSVLQVLASTPNFVDSILNSQAILFMNLSSIFSLMFLPRLTNSFKREILQLLNTLKEKFPMYELNSQNDCKELYNILIDNYIQEFSNAKKIFQITKNQTFKCENGHENINSEESLFFIIATKDKLNAKACIEIIERGENKLDLWCECCKEVNNSIIRVRFLELPDILVFYVTDRSSKNRKPPIDINYKENNYRIYAVICYYDAGQISHYIAYTCDDRKWYKYNDAFVEEDQPDYDHAYMLFYSKLNKRI